MATLVPVVISHLNQPVKMRSKRTMRIANTMVVSIAVLISTMQRGIVGIATVRQKEEPWILHGKGDVKQVSKVNYNSLFGELCNLMEEAPCQGKACIGYQSCVYGISGCYGSTCAIEEVLKGITYQLSTKGEDV